MSGRGFALRRPESARRLPVGRSGEPVIVIDRISADPATLLEEAARAAFTPADNARGGFPGLRAPAPDDYVAALVEAVDPLIRSAFGMAGLRADGVQASFSLVTAPPERLHKLQRLPHIDTPSPRRIAILHFLCGPPHGGTAFYRQQSTGLEQVRPQDINSYTAARAQDAERQLGVVPAYPGADTPGYVQTAAFSARLDRLLVYRSFSLHSGIIPAGSPLSADPRVGRLTANIFVDYVPA